MGTESSETNTRLTETERRIEEREKGNGSENPSTDTTNPKRGRGRPPGSTTKSGGSTNEEKLLGLAHVNEPKPVAIEVPGVEEKPKSKAGRPKKSQAAASVKVDSTNIQLMLLTISGVIASRPGMEIWNLSPEEAKQIADPLANILAKNQAVAAAMGEHADAFALIAACIMVFLPKFIAYQATKPKKPKEGDHVTYGNKPATKPQQPQREAARSRESAARPNTSSKNVTQNLGGQLHELIPVVG